MTRHLNEVATLRTGPFGSALHKSDYTTDGVPIINPMHIVDGRLRPAPETTVTEQAAEALAPFRLQAGDIVIGRRGEMGRCAVATEREAGWLCGTGSMIVRPGPSVDPGYLQLVLSSPSAVSFLEEGSVGSTMNNLNQHLLGKLPIELPPYPEQRAITQAITDASTLVNAVLETIAKKRDVKQATMQRLLTGEQRLPGFGAEWTDTQLGSVAEIVSGGTPSTAVAAFWDGEIAWCTPTDVTAERGKYLDATARTISQSGLENSGARLLPPGALLLCSRATVGEVRIAKRAVCTNQGFKSLIAGPRVDNEFLYYRVLTLKAQMIERAFGSTFLELSGRDAAALSFALPPLNEQRAIAAVLSDMDAELAALDRRLTKTRALKQAMMQELLTGRTRLVPDAT